MATLKCKYCGGNVEQFPGNSLGTCCDCGSRMTLPPVEDDQRAAAHNCGNYFRRMGNYEKGLAVYQKILQEDPSDAEASWCSALCRYGIQYELCPNGEYTPVSQQAPAGSFLQDGDYLAALAHSDGAVQLQYEQEAARINAIWAPTIAAPDAKQMLNQGYLLLEQSQWEGADEQFRQSLELLPNNAMAWLGRLLAEEKCCRPKDLINCGHSIQDSQNYQNALAFADDKLKKTLESCASHLQKSSSALAIQESYRKACAMMKQASTQEQYTRVAAMFNRLSGFRDSAAREAECLKHAEIAKKDSTYLAAVSLANNAKSIGDYERALYLFEQIPGWRDTDERIRACKAGMFHVELALATPKKRIWPKVLAICAVLLLVTGVSLYYAMKLYFIPEGKYKTADALLLANDRARAIAAFQELGDYKDAADRALAIQEDWYREAEAMLDRMEFARAAATFGSLGDFADARERSWDLWNSIAVRKTLQAGGWYTAALQNGGTALAMGNNRDGQCNVAEWEDIISIDAGWAHTIGLREDGTVVSAGYNSDGRGDVDAWQDIVAIAAGQWHTVGLRMDGQVIGTGCDNDGRLDFSLWKEIADISAGRNHTVGLRADGTVVAVGSNASGQCNVSNWRGITAIAAGGEHTVGLKADGTVVAVGNNDDRKCQVEKWEDIVAIAAGYYHTVGLKSDGTVVATGWDRDGQCNVSKWKDIVAIAAGGWHTVGLKADGTIVAVGRNVEDQCNLSEWTNLVKP